VDSRTTEAVPSAMNEESAARAFIASVAFGHCVEQAESGLQTTPTPAAIHAYFPNGRPF